MPEHLNDRADGALRVGVLLADDWQVAWIRCVLEQIVAAPFATLGAVVTSTSLVPSRPGRIFRAYERADRKLFPSERDALAETDLSDLLADVPRVPIDGLDALRAMDLDLVIAFWPDPRTTALAACTKRGAWVLRSGSPGRVGPTHFWEMREGQAVCETALLAVRPGHESAEVIYRSHAAVDPVSLQRSRNAALWKTSYAFGRRLRRMYQEGSPTRHDIERDATAPLPTEVPALPRGRDVARLVTRIAAGVAARRTRKLLFRDQWFLAYRRGGKRGNLREGPAFDLLQPASDRYYADPFLWTQDDSTYVFFEDFEYARGRGVIACAELGGEGPPAPRPVLERPYHLSYPFVFAHAGDVYMVPESSEARRIELFRAARFPGGWEPVEVLLDDIVAVDPTIVEHAGRFWLFAGVALAGTTSVDELFLFSSDRLLGGEWVPHPLNPIVTDVRHARPAGRIYPNGNALIRPAQDCAERYGRAIVLNRIDVLTETDYHETVVGRMEPDWLHGNLASHTYTFAGDFEAVDATFNRLRFAL